jgi:hypothetical protein
MDKELPTGLQRVRQGGELVGVRRLVAKSLLSVLPSRVTMIRLSICGTAKAGTTTVAAVPTTVQTSRGLGRSCR